ncbi:3,4-dihydroxy-2-butanone 4-phosphate synthase [Xylona heveae TC161]|uniref:3,4-dihydroxy-2-butanone 4-phosphate synthase n=1 Tax=Xylona heveae (strain CBS 132557 / TC161) TaxID=1328760 RepID=A0A165HB01_XYLHT|nr:3,4-dihydroxy-2-butanone 4-phosphate synthase [Xylona heveae TC161]KZF23236.1 3,4-dihydroxy-2-butanone 4-phosphate synthase [Xylona heveae TC161]
MPTSTPELRFSTIEETIEAFRQGHFIIVLDSASRENEGDLILAAEDMTTNKMAFMIRHSSGYVCAPMYADRTSKLQLPQMVQNNADPNQTAYTITVDADHPTTTTGISAHDRALTCRVLADPETTVSALRRPGHVLPLRACNGGVRERRGHTEAAVEFCRLAGKKPVGAICELVIDGEPVPGVKGEMQGAGMMRRDDCIEFGKKWGLPVCTIEDLVAYVEKHEGKLNPVNGN